MASLHPGKAGADRTDACPLRFERTYT